MSKIVMLIGYEIDVKMVIQFGVEISVFSLSELFFDRLVSWSLIDEVGQRIEPVFQLPF